MKWIEISNVLCVKRMIIYENCCNKTCYHIWLIDISIEKLLLHSAHLLKHCLTEKMKELNINFIRSYLGLRIIILM